MMQSTKGSRRAIQRVWHPLRKGYPMRIAVEHCFFAKLTREEELPVARETVRQVFVSSAEDSGQVVR